MPRCGAGIVVGPSSSVSLLARPAAVQLTGREGAMSSVRPSLPGVTQAPAVKARPAEKRQQFAGYQTPRFRDTPVGQFLVRRFLACASLRLAVTLLSLFTFCLALA